MRSCLEQGPNSSEFKACLLSLELLSPIPSTHMGALTLPGCSPFCDFLKWRMLAHGPGATNHSLPRVLFTSWVLPYAPSMVAWWAPAEAAYSHLRAALKGSQRNLDANLLKIWKHTTCILKGRAHTTPFLSQKAPCQLPFIALKSGPTAALVWLS